LRAAQWMKKQRVQQPGVKSDELALKYLANQPKLCPV